MLKKFINRFVRQTELPSAPAPSYIQKNLNKKMTKITINDKEYDTDNMSDEAKGQLQSLQFASSEVKRLQSLLAINKTAQAAYTKALMDSLEEAE
jgi:hypothetical protein